ncbi:hypothetical protein MBLNU230_g5554t1 [Neophaeotheca triangularis]
MYNPHDLPLTWNEALSGITGSISLAAWIFLLVPQLIENYTQSSAEGISLTFLIIWFVGDVTNLIGAVWAGLVPTVVALAVYFCFADTVLIAQCLYYNALNRKKNNQEVGKSGEEEAGERAPLLDGDNNNTNTTTTTPAANRQKQRTLSSTSRLSDNTGLPGSHLRRPSTRSLTHPDPIAETSTPPTKTSPMHPWLKNTLSIFAIILAGAAGWALAYKTGAWTVTPRPTHHTTDPSSDSTPLGASLLGYFSAVAYLGARIPQILKNHREKSCEGLSLLFFLLSLLGNATYGAGILFHSVEKGYVMTNLPWLVGSLGTMGEDCVVFGQFRWFGDKAKLEGRGEDGGEEGEGR